MSQDFSDLPEPLPGSEAPLEAMASCNQRLLLHCASLRRLALYVGECGFDAQARAANERLLRFFDHALPLHHADASGDLFPALIESMAGSDAVCLHELSEGLGRQQHEVRRLWLRLRPALLDLASGRATALPVQEVETLIAQCRSCVDAAQGELLPMAARLLSQAQLDQLGSAMRARRSAPT